MRGSERQRGTISGYPGRWWIGLHKLALQLAGATGISTKKRAYYRKCSVRIHHKNGWQFFVSTRHVPTPGHPSSIRTKNGFGRQFSRICGPPATIGRPKGTPPSRSMYITSFDPSIVKRAVPRTAVYMTATPRLLYWLGSAWERITTTVPPLPLMQPPTPPHIRRWWLQAMGKKRYPNPTGSVGAPLTARGSNAYRVPFVANTELQKPGCTTKVFPDHRVPLSPPWNHQVEQDRRTPGFSLSSAYNCSGKPCSLSQQSSDTHCPLPPLPPRRASDRTTCSNLDEKL